MGTRPRGVSYLTSAPETGAASRKALTDGGLPRSPPRRLRANPVP